MQAKSLICFALLVSMVFSGHIYYLDPETTYGNTGEVTQININFKLTNTLPTGLMVEADFGVSLGTSKGYLFEMGSPSYTTALTTTLSSNIIRVVTKSDLSNTKWYTLAIKPDSVPGSLTAGLVVGPIKLSTISGTTDGIVYDRNPVGPSFAVQVAATTSDITLAKESDVDTKKNDLDASHDVDVAITNAIYRPLGGYYILKLSSTDFSFTADCKGKAVPCASGAPSGCKDVVVPTGFSCKKVDAQNLEVKVPAWDTNKFVVTVNVKNPTYIATAVNLDVKAVSMSKHTVLSTKSLSSLASVTAPTLTTAEPKYHWGITKRTTSNYDKAHIGLYREDNSVANTGVYNSVHLYVTFAKACPHAEHQVIFDLIETGKLKYLTGSFVTDLPKATGKELTYTISDQKVTVGNVGPLAAQQYTLSLRCTLAHDAAASISAFGKVNVNTITTAVATALISATGGNTVATVKNLFKAGTAQKAALGLSQVASVDKISTPGTAASVTTALLDLVKGSPDGKLGLQIKSAAQTLVFFLSAYVCTKTDAGSDMCIETAGVGGAAFTTAQKKEFSSLFSIVMPITSITISSTEVAKGVLPVMNMFGKKDNSPVLCSSSSLVLNDNVSPETGKTCSDYNTQSQGNLVNTITEVAGKYRYIAFACVNPSNPAATKKANSYCSYTSDVLTDGKNGGVIIIPEVTLPSYNGPTQYADANVMEFPLVFLSGDVAGAAANFGTVNQNSLLQAYAITGVPTANFNQVVLVNQVSASDSTAAQTQGTGEYWPVLLRVSGKISVGGSAITAFFGIGGASNLNPNYAANGKAGAYPCVSTDGTAVTCTAGGAPKAVEDAFYMNQNYVTVNAAVTADTEFNFYVPISAPDSNVNKKALNIAAHLVPQSASVNAGVFRCFAALAPWGAAAITTNSKYTIDTFKKTISNTNYEGCVFTSYGFELGNTFLAGAAPSTVTVDTKTTACTNMAVGNDVKGTTVSLIALTSNLWSGVTAKFGGTDKTCGLLSYQYPSSSGTVHNRWVLVCKASTVATSSTVTLTGFKIPGTWGKAYTIGTDFQTGVSNNQGQLVYLKANENQGSVANTACELTALSATFPKSVTTRASFQVKTTKPLDVKNTKLVDITLTMASGNNYFSAVTTCSTTSFASTCGTSNSGLTFKHTATADVTGVQTIVTDFIGTSNTETGATTYTAVIKYETFEIDACTTAKAWKGSGADASKFKTTVSPFSYMTKDAKQSFTVTFGVAGSQNIGSTDTVVFNFGSYLASAKLTGSRCVPLTGGKIAAGWQKISSASWAAVTLTASATVTGSSTLTCYGVGPAGTGTTKLTGVWKTANAGNSESANDVNAPDWQTGYTTTTTALDATLSKNETVAGQATVYGLLIKPDNNYTNPVVRVVFANQIAPRLNPCGVLTCKQDGYPVNCQWSNEEGVVLINSREDFVKKSINAGGYNFQIWGVVQPKTVATGDKMVVSITTGSTVTEIVELSEIAPGSAKTVKVAEVVTGSYSSNTTRSTTDIVQNITLPSASVIADAVGTVLLPDWVPCFNAPSVSVSLTNYMDTANTEFVKSASVNPNCSVSIVLNVDSLNAAKAQNYKFTVSNVPTPVMPNGGMSSSWPVLNLIKGSDLYKNFPGSSDVKPIVFVEPAATVYATVNWNAPVVDAYVGYWSSGAKLVPAGGSFPTTTTLTVGGATSSISVAPAKPLVSVGAKDAKMMIGAKAGTKRGLYRLTFTKGATDSSSLSPIPDLRVNVKDTKCTLNVPSSINVPAGGVSVPQVITLDSCLPLVDVSLEATWTDPNAVVSSSATPDTKPTFTLDKATKTVKYAAGMKGAMIYYILSNNNATLKAQSSVRKLYWKLGGTNKASYALSTASSNMGIAAAAGTESPTATVTATPAAGKVDLTLTCNQVGYVVWAAAYETTTNPIGSVTLDSISAATFNASIPLTMIDSNNNDLVQGFNIVTTKDKAIKVTLKMVASALKYNLVAYCVSGSKTSPSKTATWTQTDNGGKPSVIQFTASSQLTDAEQVKLVCGCVKTLALPVPRITSQNGATCTSLLPASSTSSTRMLQNATNTTNTTTTTPAVPSVYPAFVFVAPDVYAVADTTNTFVTNEVAKSTFKADVISKGNLPASVNISAVVSKTVTASVATAPTPTFVDATPAATNNSLSVNARLDAEGFVFLGVIIANGATKPTAQQLVGGKDGADGSLNSTNNAYTDKNTNKLVNLTGLSALTEYKVYLCASNIAATKDRVYSTVIEKTMTTLNAYVLSMASMVMIALFGFAIMI